MRGTENEVVWNLNCDSEVFILLYKIYIIIEIICSSVNDCSKWDCHCAIYVVFNKKNICTKQADPFFNVYKSIKNNGAKRNQGTFEIDKNVWLIAS